MEPSKSTDKLFLLLSAIKDVPQETLKRVSHVELTWTVIYDAVVPIVKIEFRDR